MQGAMDRLGRFLERRRWLVVGVWLAVLLASAPFGMRQTEHLTSGGFVVPGSGSEAVDNSLHQFDRAQRDSLAVVLAQKPGSSPADVRAAVDRVSRAADRLDHAQLAPAVAAQAKREAGRGPIVVVPLDVPGAQDELSDLAVDLRTEVGAGAGPRDGVQTYLVGQQALWAGMQDLSKEDLEAAERTGFPIVLLILLAVFGSLAAAALPLALGFVSVSITGAGIFFLSQATDMSVFVTNVASMIGIGVAVDYSLFILARYREEVRAGREPAQARAVAMRTSGLAVAFSGVTVMISLAGLFLVDSTTIRSMAMGAIIVVAISILGATTLLPVLIRLLGTRAYARGRIATVTELLFRSLHWRRRRPGSTRDVKPDFWTRWTDRVTRRPGLAAVASAAILLVLAIPALSLEFGDGALRQFPKDNETRVGAELAAKRLGPGSAGPTQVIAERAQARAVGRRLRDDREVARVSGPVASQDGRSVLFTAAPRHDPESPQARALVDRLRASGSRVEVGGATASVEDFKDLVSGSMWKIALFVLAFSYLVLFLLLRSVLLPLKAVVMNLLSVGAAYGILVAVFQYGWLDGLLGFDSLGYINTMTPPLLLAIVFGLSMDYEVFLLTRIRERYEATGDNKLAVAQGLRASAATISSAALIMVAVFAVFAGTGVPSIKEIGLGLAVAIALDATLVRLVLVPATMELMGKWNWWVPRPLAKLLPRADFEGSAA
jgi:uncharacterized membrane protein YdfJ with MMPL/SSD domain